MESLPFLTDLTIILFVGIMCTVLARYLRISNVLLLILAGIGLTQITFPGRALFDFPPAFLTIIAIIALVIIVFDSSARFKWKLVDQLTGKALKLAIVFLFVNAFLLSIAVSYLFYLDNLFLILIFAATMGATAADVCLNLFKNHQGNKIIELLRIESIINTPLTVLIPFIILDLMKALSVSSDESQGKTLLLTTLFEQLKPFISQFVVGIGAGVIIGLILGKIFKKGVPESFSPLLLIGSAFLAYILAEHLGGNGILAVTVTGLFFGNYYVEQKKELYSFPTLFGNFLMILVFILVGIGFKITGINLIFFLNSLKLFGIYILIRFLAVYISSMHDKSTFKERLFMTLIMPKGIGIATVIFVLSTQIAVYPELKSIIDLMVLFVLYSLVFATIVAPFTRFWLGKGIENKNSSHT
ncbi:cation:proton antiporter [Candidatus Woesearchaeota archaeon]|nr:cation:proton antiporter [Candidatus Woesearchaeota archaeon]